ncbi:hypothetical protein PpBr36_01955 [Pyricularia pennisetigena]|uniref:hypothetical protein n=1 Tax=Pyricularia pennisetigena TaxID=1578925 RepID=UPI00114F0F9C|nr:hypothetical protein PpBr36_01955 [Pyricularia pennisetigena]TLS29387.1 hypothetical protein PpBr36_01955 [Pyricularia pennisetigena]
MSSQPYTHFLVHRPAPGVAHVEINRPDKLNSFYEEMWCEFGRVFNALSVDPEVRAVVLSGAGERAFTSGLDVQKASDGWLVKGMDDGSGQPVDSARFATYARRHIAEFQDSISAMEKCEKPVICVLHGLSLGLAIDLACCADVRLVARGTRMAVKEVDIGLAADIGTLSRLPKAVGSLSWVKEVCLSAREFTPEEALAVGFVSGPIHETKADALKAALSMATLIAGKSPVAVQGTKELLNHARDHSVEESLRYTTVWNSAALQTRDIKDALLSGIQKRKATFAKL